MGLFSKLGEYSYSDMRSRTHKRLRAVLWAALLVAAYVLLTNYLFTIKSVKSGSMRPGVNPGERIIFASFGINHLIEKALPSGALPLKRGAIVLVNRAAGEKRPVFKVCADYIVRFFTAGNKRIFDDQDRVFIKRVLALPGDEISMVNYVLRVKPAEDQYTYTEYEVVKNLYDILIPNTPALWDKSIPFSGNIDTMTLADGEYFLLSDDRGNTNDSRTWGPVPSRYIAGKAIFRYWPLSSLGIPGRSPREQAPAQTDAAEEK